MFILIALYSLLALLDLLRRQITTGNKVVLSLAIILLPILGPSFYYIYKAQKRLV